MQAHVLLSWIRKWYDIRSSKPTEICHKEPAVITCMSQEEEEEEDAV